MRRAIATCALVLGLGLVALGVASAWTPDAWAQSDDDLEEGEAPPPPKTSSTSTLKTVGAYALGLVGVGILLVAVTKTTGGLSYPSARMSLVNLLRTNPNQAELVARNMKGTFGMAIGEAMKTAAMGGSPDPKIVSAATAPTYDATCQGIVANWKAVLSKGKLGILAAGGGFVLGLTNGGFPVGPFILVLIAGACFAKVFLFIHETEATLVRARAEVLPEAERALCSGRYVFPAPQ